MGDMRAAPDCHDNGNETINYAIQFQSAPSRGQKNENAVRQEIPHLPPQSQAVHRPDLVLPWRIGRGGTVNSLQFPAEAGARLLVGMACHFRPSGWRRLNCRRSIIQSGSVHLAVKHNFIGPHYTTNRSVFGCLLILSVSGKFWSEFEHLPVKSADSAAVSTNCRRHRLSMGRVRRIWGT